MAVSRVKQKFPFAIALALAALLTAVLSWARVFPAGWVERGYSRHIFPTISHIASFLADAVPFSWLDLEIAGSILLLFLSFRRRNWRLTVGVIAAAYLIFFWGWGLNYHRLPLETRLGLENTPEPTAEDVKQFGMNNVADLNRLWPIVAEGTPSPGDRDAIARIASVRVRRVISGIDGSDWTAATRIKHTYLAGWWFRAAGIDGVFNPLAHEPVLNGDVLDFELPFLMSHELAHVHGIADEGDADVVALLATVASDDPRFQYSAAFEMFLYLHGPVDLMYPGPRRDLQAYSARVLSQEVPQVTRVQSAILDSHLKANGIKAGIRSYSRIVALAIATRDRWKDFQ